MATTVVEQSIAEAGSIYVGVYRVAAIADLNGDGRMEVVIDGFGYEDEGTGAYELDADGVLRRVLGAGCGA